MQIKEQYLRVNATKRVLSLGKTKRKENEKEAVSNFLLIALILSASYYRRCLRGSAYTPTMDRRWIDDVDNYFSLQNVFNFRLGSLFSVIPAGVRSWKKVFAPRRP